MTGYPVPPAKVESVAVSRDLVLDAEVTAAIAETRAYKLAYADLLVFLATAPDVSQGGVTIKLPADARRAFRAQALRAYTECGETMPADGNPAFGYKGGWR